MFKTKRFFLLVLVLLILLISTFQTSISAAKYPERAVEIIVAWSAGGSTDVVARILAGELEKILGQRFLVINKPGAGGEIGFTEIALAKPDGYTIGMINIPAAITPYLFRPEACKYTIESFTPIANIITDPGTVTVRADSPFNTLEDFVEYAKEHPGALPIANDGIGASSHLNQLVFEYVAGIELNKVPFAGDAPQRAAVLGGHIAACGIKGSEAYPYVKEGTMRILGVMTKKRVSFLPDVPTFEEQGYPVFAFSARGVVAPKGLPVEIRKILADAIAKVVASPEFVEKAQTKLKMPIDYIAGDEYVEFLKEQDKLTRIIWEKVKK
jgi:tripartite-type tricarboxylate transporter receptor subunit TctC